MRTNPRKARVDKFLASHKAVTDALRKAINSPADLERRGQRDLFAAATFDTPDAKLGYSRCIKMTIAEAHAITRMALPPSACTIPTRKEHALLMIALSVFLQELAMIETDTIPPTAISAALAAIDHIKSWVRMNNWIIPRRDERYTTDFSRHHTVPDAINRVPKRGKKPAPFGQNGFPADWHNTDCKPASSTKPKTFLPWEKAR